MKTKFRRDSHSSIAVEYALIAPLLILLGLGAVEFSAAVRVQLSADRAARTVAFLISESASPITAPQMADYYIAGIDCYQGPTNNMAISAASFVFTPIGATTGQDTAAAGGWDANTNGAFTSTTTGATYIYAATPSTVAAQTSGLSDGTTVDSVIAVTATTTYTLPFLPNFFGVIPKGPFSFTATSFARPRQVLVIAKGWSS